MMALRKGGLLSMRGSRHGAPVGFIVKFQCHLRSVVSKVPSVNIKQDRPTITLPVVRSSVEQCTNKIRVLYVDSRMQSGSFNLF
ncbi:hypothetical protein PM082_001397 [Marasmius tenuissimus]|nr:hypothetical protein PM082_001397 [Marasmius tenuissimus]